MLNSAEKFLTTGAGMLILFTGKDVKSFCTAHVGGGGGNNGSVFV